MNFKRLMKLMLIMFVILSLTCTNISVVQARLLLGDVPESHQYNKAIKTLVNDGVIDGNWHKETNTYTFNPEGLITRAEAVKLITTALIGRDVSSLTTTNKFSDVPENHWANKYINYARETNITDGYSDGTFRPSAHITYAEVVKMLVCAKGYGKQCYLTEPWYNSYFIIAGRLGITKNIEHPAQWEVSRGVVAQLIYNYKYEVEIPKMYFTGDIENLPLNKDSRDVQFRYVGPDCTVDGSAKIKLQGTSSLLYNKKNYTVNFYTDSTYSNKLKMDFGWGPQNKYCLKANWIDKTHARNVVTAKIVTQMQEKYNLFNGAPANAAIDGFPIEVYANNKFHGLYTLNIPKDEWMFAMDSNNPDNIVVGGEDWSDTTRFKAMPNFKMWEVEVGEENEHTLSRLNDLFGFVLYSSDDKFKNEFGNHLSLSATLNYYIMTDFAYLLDNMGKNMLLATYDGKKWYPCLYDLDTAWGTDTTGYGLLAYEQYLIGFDDNRLFERLEENFPHELAERYFELREDVLTKNNVMLRFNEFKNLIPPASYARELLKWGPKLPGYEISQIEAFLDNMIPRLDQKYKNLKAR